MKYSFVVNTASNNYKIDRLRDQLTAEIQEVFPDALISFVDDASALLHTANKLARKSDVLVACGGDGTVSTLASVVAGTAVKLGVLPLGSGNDYAKNLDLSRDIKSNLKVLETARVLSVDYLDVDGKVVINTMGLGLDGVSNWYAAHMSLLHPEIRYAIGATLALVTYRSFFAEIETNEVSWTGKTPMIVVANGPVEGGRYRVSPKSDFQDGTMELVIVRKVNRLRILWQFLKLTFGGELSSSIIQTISCEQATIRFSKPVRAHQDGEDAGFKRAVQCGIRAGTLQVIAP